MRAKAVKVKKAKPKVQVRKLNRFFATGPYGVQEVLAHFTEIESGVLTFYAVQQDGLTKPIAVFREWTHYVREAE